MQCREFLRHLHDYLRGRVPEPLFGSLVEHEAECRACSAAAAEMDVDPSSAFLRSSSEENNLPMRAILSRTAGRDCRWIEFRMAEALEEDLTSEVGLLVADHLRECPSCQRMRDMLEALPAYYAALPTMRARSAFTDAVLARTSGRRPTFLDVVRALWRRPEAMWEAALACAVAVMLLFGQSVPTVDEVTERVQAVSQATGLSNFDPLQEGPEILRPLRATFLAGRDRWERFEESAVEVSEWTLRVGTSVRERDLGALLREIRLVLEPFGLYPGNGQETESVLPDVQTNSAAPAGADSTQTTFSGDVR